VFFSSAADIPVISFGPLYTLFAFHNELDVPDGVFCDEAFVKGLQGLRTAAL